MGNLGIAAIYFLQKFYIVYFEKTIGILYIVEVPSSHLTRGLWRNHAP
jgi:hypothetical protein